LLQCRSWARCPFPRPAALPARAHPVTRLPARHSHSHRLLHWAHRRGGRRWVATPAGLAAGCWLLAETHGWSPRSAGSPMECRPRAAASLTRDLRWQCRGAVVPWSDCRWVRCGTSRCKALVAWSLSRSCARRPMGAPERYFRTRLGITMHRIAMPPHVGIALQGGAERGMSGAHRYLAAYFRSRFYLYSSSACFLRPLARQALQVGPLLWFLHSTTLSTNLPIHASTRLTMHKHSIKTPS
jgi:hypothetical protein